MKIINNIFMASVIMLLIVCNSYAESVNPPFSATCEDVVIHGYRDGTDISGKPMKESWTTNERLNSKWKFIYSGGKNIIIDGKKLNIIEQHPGVIVTGESATNGIASGIWTYAIHLILKKVVAAQVNAHGHFEEKGKDQGVKARVVNMKCKFKIHKTSK